MKTIKSLIDNVDLGKVNHLVGNIYSYFVFFSLNSLFEEPCKEAAADDVNTGSREFLLKAGKNKITTNQIRAARRLI